MFSDIDNTGVAGVVGKGYHVVIEMFCLGYF